MTLEEIIGHPLFQVLFNPFLPHTLNLVAVFVWVIVGGSFASNFLYARV